VAPSATIKGPNTGLTPNFFGWIAVDGSGDIFASSGGFETVFSDVLMFPSGSNGNIAPATILAGPHTQLAIPEGLAVVGSP